MSGWLTKLITVLELETVDDDLLNHIDEILSWESVRDQDELYLKLLKELGDQVINERFEEFLDRLIVGDFALGEMFPLSLNIEQAKKRYRKLIRVFHPDRGFKSQIWLNYRAERINKAYQLFLNGDEVQADISVDDFSERTSNSKTDAVKSKPAKFKIKPKFRYRPSVWRDRLGSPQEFQKKAVLALLFFSLFLVFLVFLSNKENGTQATLSSNFEDAVTEQEKTIVEEYVVDSNAKRILQEADVFLAEDEQAVFDDLQIDSEISDELSLPSSSSVTQLNEFISELEEVELPINQEGKNHKDGNCHVYGDLSLSSEINSDKNKVKKLQSKQNLRTGPSPGCDLLESLALGSEVYIHAQTKDKVWAKVILAGAGKELVGWIDMQGITDKFNKPTGSIKQKAKNVDVKPSQAVNNSSVRLPPVSHVIKPTGFAERQALQQGKQSVFKQASGGVVESASKPVYLDLVEELKSYYESGDSRRMSELYIGSGRENKIRGSNSIRKYYRKAFSKTENRKFNYVIDSYRLEEQSTALIKGKMYLSMQSKKTGKVSKIDAFFTIVLVKLGSQFKITSFEWNKV